MATHHITITGKVQGVFFRATAKKVALAMGLSGWVKNTDKGEVEIMASGDAEKLASFENWCQSGPPEAEVQHVVVTSGEETLFQDFKIIR